MLDIAKIEKVLRDSEKRDDGVLSLAGELIGIKNISDKSLRGRPDLMIKALRAESGSDWVVERIETLRDRLFVELGWSPGRPRYKEGQSLIEWLSAAVEDSGRPSRTMPLNYLSTIIAEALETEAETIKQCSFTKNELFAGVSVDGYKLPRRVMGTYVFKLAATGLVSIKYTNDNWVDEGWLGFSGENTVNEILTAITKEDKRRKSATKMLYEAIIDCFKCQLDHFGEIQMNDIIVLPSRIESQVFRGRMTLKMAVGGETFSHDVTAKTWLGKSDYYRFGHIKNLFKDFMGRKKNAWVIYKLGDR
jgi:hypothetical protein